MILNTIMKYKTLIVSGCSYTENPGSWAYALASKYNLELVNLAVPGVGNRHILFSLLLYLTKNNVDPETTLIGIMWSHPMRRHQVIEFNPEYSDNTIYKYEYDQYNRAVTNIDFYGKLDMSHPLVREEVYKNTVVLSNYNRSGHTLETWTYVESTIAYLVANKFNFFQTAFLDYLNGSDLIKNNSEWTPQHEYYYTSELERIGLIQNKVNWVDLTHEQYLGEYAYFANKLDSDNMHPSQDCHLQWTTEILIPKLEKMQILHTIKS